jgi:hypothetical protein
MLTQKLFVAIALPCLAAVGCGDNATTISGAVSINGEPVKEGTIGFFPVDGNARTTGTKIRDGKYSAEVSPGAAKVEIRVSKVVGESKLYDTPNSETRPIRREVLPPKYNNETELQVEIKAGRNESNFDLKTN